MINPIEKSRSIFWKKSNSSRVKEKWRPKPLPMGQKPCQKAVLKPELGLNVDCYA